MTSGQSPHDCMHASCLHAHTADGCLCACANPPAAQGFSNVELSQEDVLCIIRTLEYDGLVEGVEAEDGEMMFRPSRHTIPEASPFTQIPCGVCPVRTHAPLDHALLLCMQLLTMRCSCACNYAGSLRRLLGPHACASEHTLLLCMRFASEQGKAMTCSVKGY